MRRVLMVSILAFAVVLAIFVAGRPARALPEYSSQTGEPCATCHISPSGGGVRTPRGQAWVGGGKPGSVPDLEQALELLGVHLEVDERDYRAAPGNVTPAQPLTVRQEKVRTLQKWLREYEGN